MRTARSLSGGVFVQGRVSVRGRGPVQGDICQGDPFPPVNRMTERRV